MFTGVYEHTIDKKGRTSMPARFRNELGGEAGLKRLRDAAEAAGGKVYPDAAVQLVTEIAKGFFRSEEAAPVIRARFSSGSP